ncbi:MAG: hypothetical protein IAG13_14955 [Deltaproteobacteria bacterium]|nr:hypothetical protein [Nannocystaceae bacterium]
MSGPLPSIRGFKPVFTVIGALYVALASSMLVRGAAALVDFGVAPELAAEPVLADFFLFFYQLMAFVGVLTIVVGWVVHGRRGQALVAAVFCAANVLWALRDLGTSDSAFGNRLYQGEVTLVFVAIDVALALAFGAVAIRGSRRDRGRR